MSAPRKYKLEVQRDGQNAVLYYHEDETLELTDPDSGLPADYLETKVRIMQLLFDWCKKYNISRVECSEVTQP